MSGRTRQRWLFLHNYLEELASRVGQLEPSVPQGVDVDPSWGPVGSLLLRTEPLLYEHLRQLDEDTNRMERARAAAQAAPEPVAPSAAAQAAEATPKPTRRASTLPATSVHVS